MADHVRRVASVEGSQYYGLPIGAPITADVKAKAQALHGAEPSGASKKSVSNKGANAAAATNAKAAADQAAQAAGKIKPPATKTKLKKPTIKGNMHFKVGSADYTAPNGSKLFKQKGVDGLAYVKTPDGKVHIFNENGEVETDSKAILQALSAKFEGDISPDDPDFEAADFDKVGAHYSLDQMPIGGVLTDQRGNPVFTKNEDGTWHNDELGVDLDEKSVKPLFDSGDLVPESTPNSDAMSNALADQKAVNLSELDYDAAVDALDKMPEGMSLQADDTVFTKQKDGWTSPTNEKPIPSAIMAYAKNDLKPSDGAQVTPDMAEDPKGAPAPKTPSTDTPDVPAAPKATPEVTDRAAASKQAIADANPYKPQPVDWETTYPEDETFPKETTKTKDIEDAQPGDTMLAAYYSDDDESSDPGDYYDIAVFTKQEDGSWWDQDSIQKLSQDEMNSLVGDPEVKVYPNKDNKGPGVAREKAKADRLKAKEVSSKNSKPEEQDKNNEAGQETAAVGDGGIDLPNESEASATPKEPSEPQKTWDHLQAGDTPTVEWVNSSPVGSSVSFTNGEDYSNWTKSENGWTEDNGTTLEPHYISLAVEESEGEGYTGTVSITSVGHSKAVQEGLAAAAPDAPDHMSVGGKPNSVEHLKEYAEGTTLLYTKKDGSKSTYTKLGNGDYLTPGGQVMPAEKFKSSVKTGKFEVGSLPAEVQAPVTEDTGSKVDAKYLVPNAPIDKFGALNGYRIGTKIKESAGPEYGGIPLVKTEEGWHSEKFGTYPNADIEEALKKGDLYFVSSPVASDDSENHELDSAGPDVHSTDKDISFDNSGLAFSAAELKEAHDAMEAHSGPQIAYGLKSVPDNVFAGDKELQDKLKAWGKSAYPELPPKQAALQVLKDKLGLKADVAEAKKNLGAPEISFGSEGDSIKTTATGLTGGMYSADDVSEAISILEGFNGKNFKSELNKQGNPLGQLSPNDLVGFNKDKTVTKQKFIDLMKQKLSAHQAEQAANEPPELADWEKELLSGTSLVPGDKFSGTVETMDAFAAGTQVSNGYITYTKNDNGMWSADGVADTSFSAAAFKDLDLSVVSLGHGEIVSSPPAPVASEINEIADAGPSIGSIADKNDIPDMLPGTVLLNQIGKKFTKIGANTWTKDGVDNHLSDANVLYETTPNFFYAHLPTADEAVQWQKDLDSVEYADEDFGQEGPVSYEIGGYVNSSDVNDYDNAPVGMTLMEESEDGFSTDTTFYTKQADGSWLSSEGNTVMSSQDLADFKPEEGYIVMDTNVDHENAPTALDIETEAPQVKVGSFVQNVAELDAQPAGTKITSDTGHVLTKLGDGQWLGATDTPYSSQEISASQKPGEGNDFPSVYHYSFIPGNDGAVDTEKHLSKEDIENAGIGTVVTWHAGDGSFTSDYKKIGDKKWYAPDTDTELDEQALTGVLGHSIHYTLASAPNGVPAHADTPNAVKDKDHDDATITPDDIDNAEIGALYANTDGSLYVKTGENSWEKYDKDSGLSSAVMANSSLKKGIEEGWLQHVPYDGPEYNKSGLMPGKYSSGGAAYMVVHADGTGTYVNGKGVASKLTSYKVKKNHESGMNKYQGIPDTVPPIAETPKATPQAKPAKIGNADIPDGTYFQGDPSNPKAAVYHVEGDTVTMQKPLGSTPESNKKIGQDANLNWFANANVGAKITGQGGQYFEANKVYVKTQNDNGHGVWEDEQGNTLDLTYISGYQYAYATVTSHGLALPETFTKAKLQTQAKKGMLTDQYGNSIVPAGYTGDVMFFGSKTSMPALLKAKAEFEKNPDLPNTALKQMGVYTPAGNATKYVLAHHGELSIENNRTAVKDTINKLTAGVDTSHADTDAADLFQYNSLGSPMPPAEMSVPYSYQKSSKKAYIKGVADSFGGGGIIGQHSDAMTEYQMNQWISSFKSGDFKNMYVIEVNAAASKDQSHIAGFKHPGYEGNTETNQVAWAAAVDGEVSALDSVPGNWTSGYGMQPSMAEVNNYLISAQMQNPTYLSDSEKRTWMNFHKNSSKDQVDALSLVAKQRKDSGHAQLSDAPEWTDDLQPAKSYDSLFEDKTEFPTSFSGMQATDYLNDKKVGDPELSAAHQAYYDEQPYGYDADFLNQYFQAKKDKAAADALIPVYSKDPNQKVKKSTHPIYDYHDQFGNHYFFKPRADTKEDKYRTEAEHLGNTLGRALGFKTAKSELMTLDGKYGQMQQDVGGVGDFTGFDFKTLTVKQIADIEGEHLLDYFMNNDDAKYDNAKIQADGSVVGIDKARSFGFYGQWDWEGSAADGNTTIYQNMYKAIRSGAFSKEDLDKAYLKARLHAKRISKFDETRLREMMQEGMKNRTTYNVPYTIDGKKVSQDFDGLMAAVMDRKAKLPDIFEEKWQKLYDDAKLGDLPDPKAAAPEGLTTGLLSDDAHEKMFQAKVAGKTTQLSGAHVIGGTAHLWTDQYSDGSTNMHGEMYLAPKLQETLNSFFVANASDVSGAKSELSGFEAINDPIFTKFQSAAKTVNHHVTDGEYNVSTLQAFEEQLDKMKEDLMEWSPTLASNHSQFGEDYYKFSSGTAVPMRHLDQYKLAADAYVEKGAAIQEAYYNKSTVEKIEKYTPVKVDSKSLYYSKPDGSTATPISGSNDFIIKDAETGKVSVGSLDGEWNEVEPETTSGLGQDTGIKVTKRAFTHEQSAKWVNGVKTTSKGTKANGGSPGQEWEIELPTGEVIRYRNSGATGTAQGQQGKLVFTAEGVENEADSQAAMSRIMDQLNTLGIRTDEQTETDAELTYWREMYGILASRNHSKQSNKAYQAAYDEMMLKQKEIGGDENHFLEELDEKMEPEEQAEFWRALWGKHFGDEKVEDLIANRKYIPSFAHQDYSNPDLETGKPMFYRFDADLDEMLKQDWMLATSYDGDTWERFQGGGLLSAEERLRQLDLFLGASGDGFGHTASHDQANGGSHYIYTRLRKTNHTSAKVIYSPRVMLKTRVASHSGDVYGNVNLRKNGSPSDPLYAVNSNNGYFGGSNETDIPHSATLLDDVEILAFDNAVKRNAAIQELKAKGIEMIRGVPVEDRLILHQNMADAIAKMKARWAKGEY